MQVENSPFRELEGLIMRVGAGWRGLAAKCCSHILVIPFYTIAKMCAIPEAFKNNCVKLPHLFSLGCGTIYTASVVNLHC